MKYFYDSHLGDWYWADDELEDDYLYCETCGDSDTFIGCVKTRLGAETLLREYSESWGLVDERGITEFLDKVFKEE